MTQGTPADEPLFTCTAEGNGVAAVGEDLISWEEEVTVSFDVGDEE